MIVKIYFKNHKTVPTGFNVIHVSLKETFEIIVKIAKCLAKCTLNNKIYLRVKKAASYNTGCPINGVM